MTIYILILIFGSSIASTPASFYDEGVCRAHGAMWVERSPNKSMADFVCLPVVVDIVP